MHVDGAMGCCVGAGNPAVGTQPRAHLPVLRLLLNHGAGEFVDAQNDVGDTPLIVCARQGDKDGLLLLLEAGAQPSIRNQFGDTALHVAARLGHADLIASLLEWKGVDTEATNCLGKTAGQIANGRVRGLILAAGTASGKRVGTGRTKGLGEAVVGDEMSAANTQSGKPADAASAGLPSKSVGQIASRRACDIVSSAGMVSASYAGVSQQEAPSPAPLSAATQAMLRAQAPTLVLPPEPAWALAPAQTLAPPTASPTVSPTVPSPKSASTKAARPKGRKGKGHRRSVPRQSRSWTPKQVRIRRPSVRMRRLVLPGERSRWSFVVQDQELRDAIAREGAGNWTHKAARFSVARNAASLRLRWKELETKSEGASSPSVLGEQSTASPTVESPQAMYEAALSTSLAAGSDNTT